MSERARVSKDGQPVAEVHIGPEGAVTIDGHRFHVTPIGEGRYTVTGEDGVASIVAAAGPPHALWATIGGRAVLLHVEHGQRRRSSLGTVAGDMSAPMPAAVVKILVAPGDRVTAGTALLVLEAMKMELPVRATRDGVIRSVGCTVGQLVTPGVPLVEIDA